MNAPTRLLARTSLRSWIELAVVAGCCAAVFIWLGPSNIFADTTPTGGDLGAHVWAPAFLRDELLPNWQIRGWSTDWYAGFPAFQFYMVLPYLVILAVDVALPYVVAFKLVAISGVVLLPAAGWAMARLARWQRPLPELCAAAMLLFAFQINYTIYGGNIASTLAGEFAFAMGLCAALVYFGLLLRSLETGLGRARATLALAAVALLHPITLAFAIAATVIAIAVRALHRLPEITGKAKAAWVIAGSVLLMVVVWNLTESGFVRVAVLAVLVAGLLLLEWRRAWWALTIGAVGGAVSAFWSYPFFARRAFLNDMGWEKINNVRTSLFFPDEAAGDAVRHSITWLLVLAGVAAIVGLLRWQRLTLTLVAIAATMGMAFVHWPQHRLWNARILPFWYLSLYLLAAVGVWVLADALIRSDKSKQMAQVARAAVAPVATLAAIGFVALYLGILPWQRFDNGEYRWGPLTVDQSDRNFVQGWANWNFTGYEQRSGYPTYLSLIEALSQVGEERGCGSVLWEYGAEELGSYGTPMAPMLLPHWTDRCISSMEGLYFESSPTVPFHFLMQSELSLGPSRAMRGLPYSDLDLDLGVSHLQLSGVKYYAAFSTEVLTLAEQSDLLTPVAFADPWIVYEVADSKVVEPLAYEPTVVNDAPVAGRSWTDPAVIWFNDRSSWDVHVTADGPADWERIELLPPLNEQAESRRAADVAATFTRFDQVSPSSRRALPAVTVSDVVQGGERLSFRVDRIGVPVLVKVSYFPNWQVQGAQGPYRTTPNWMVVVPTDHVVEMRFAATGVEYTAWLLTVAGILVLAYMALRPPARFRRPGARFSGGKGRGGAYKNVSIVLPAYEAAEQVGKAVREVRASLTAISPALDRFEIIVVNDGSTDDTSLAAVKAGADRVINLASNMGKGAAVRAGMLAATGNIRIFTDVDLSYPPSQLETVINRLAAGDSAGASADMDAPADVVVGNRRHNDTVWLNSASRTRAFGSRLFNLAARVVLLGNYRDTQCGLKGFTAAATEAIFPQCHVDGFAFDVEVLYLAEQNQMNVVDVPVVIENTADSTVRLVSQVFVMLSSLLNIRRRVAKGGYRAAASQPATSQPAADQSAANQPEPASRS